MPYKILKRGKEYILKSPTREYKHKTLAKARAQKRLLEDKDVKQKQKQSQKQVVTVIVNAPTKRRVGSTRRTVAPKPQIQEQVIRMIPSITPFGVQEQLAQARPLQKNLMEDDRIGRLEKSILELREPFLQKQEKHLDRVPAIPSKDSQLFPESNPIGLRPEDVDPRIFEPRVPVSGGGRTGITRQLSLESVFDGATMEQLLKFDYGRTTRGQRTEPTSRQSKAIERWMIQNE
tara:strand:+ start:1042 stop:1740 length:699 start_codon:yes stop_codon:yes gene_type:complete